MKQKKTIVIIVLCTAAFIAIADRYAFHSPEPPRIVDPFLAAARPAKFDVVGALEGDFSPVGRFEELPLGLQQSLYKTQCNNTPFGPDMPIPVIDLEDETPRPLNPRAPTLALFHFGGISSNAAYVVYGSRRPLVIVFSLKNGGGYWEALLSDDSAQDVSSIRVAIAEGRYRSTAGR